MSYRETLQKSAHAARSALCIGIDPVLENFPRELRPTGTILDIAGIATLVTAAVDMLDQLGLRPAAFKPNIGYFSACDRPLQSHAPMEERFAGSIALATVLQTLTQRMPGVPVILDSKRGDIARSSANYAREAFDVWQADALTVSPYMGDDSLEPFLRRHAGDRGVYVLVRTSNPGAARFQDLAAPEKPLYRRVLELVRAWSGAHSGLGIVAGATAPEELGEILEALDGCPVPLLIPGIGRQGGTAGEVLTVLREHRYPLDLVRINASSGALFPWGDGAAAPSDWRTSLGESIASLHRELALTSEDGERVR